MGNALPSLDAAEAADGGRRRRGRRDEALSRIALVNTAAGAGVPLLGVPRRSLHSLLVVPLQLLLFQQILLLPAETSSCAGNLDAESLK